MTRKLAYLIIPFLSRNITAVIGLLWVSVLVIKELRDFIRGIRAYFLAPLLGVGRIDFKKYGPWAGIRITCKLWDMNRWPVSFCVGNDCVGND